MGGLTAWDIFGRKLDPLRRDAIEAVDTATDPKKWAKAALHKANNEINGTYKIAHEFMARSIDGRGDITYKPSSAVAKAILGSKEFASLIKGRGNTCFRPTGISFRSDTNLKRSLHDATIQGDVGIEGKAWTFKGTVTDVYDFDFRLIPKTKTWKGFGLRNAGNIAKLMIEVGAMKTYKVTVQLEGSGKF